jgi:methylthioribose-1-phosphate isomerase
MALAAMEAARDGRPILPDLETAAARLVASRPTAVNVAWAVRRVLAAAGAVSGGAPPEAAVAEARAIAAEDERSCREIAANGAALVPLGARVLTHCNTGARATYGVGTALGVIARAHADGKGIHVWVDETRPLLQGARLTAWELVHLGVPVTIVADSAAGSLMRRGEVDLVVVGADRIVANGDVANKVGTYPLAVLARKHGIPFLVAAPASTVDVGTASGDDVVIEERGAGELLEPFGAVIAPTGASARNPAFDVTPGELITAIVTDQGVLQPPFERGLRRIAAEPRLMRRPA